MYLPGSEYINELENPFAEEGEGENKYSGKYHDNGGGEYEPLVGNGDHDDGIHGEENGYHVEENVYQDDGYQDDGYHDDGYGGYRGDDEYDNEYWVLDANHQRHWFPYFIFTAPFQNVYGIFRANIFLSTAFYSILTISSTG